MAEIFGLAKDRRRALDRVAKTICLELAKEPLLGADVMLDKARRLSWLVTMSGDSSTNTVAFLRTPSLAVQIALHYEKLTIEEIQYCDAMVRRALWSAVFAALPLTRFGKLLAASIERQTVDNPATLH